MNSFQAKGDWPNYVLAVSRLFRIIFMEFESSNAASLNTASTDIISTQEYQDYDTSKEEKNGSTLKLLRKVYDTVFGDVEETVARD